MAFVVKMAVIPESLRRRASAAARRWPASVRTTSGGAVCSACRLSRSGFKARSLSGAYRELPSSGIFVTENTFNDRREPLVKLARSVARATLFALTNPHAAVAIMVKVAPHQFQSIEAGRTLFDTYLDLSTPLRRDSRGEPVFGYAMPEGWERLQKILLSGETPVLAKRLDLTAVVTGELIPDINRFDRDKVRQQARAFNP